MDKILVVGGAGYIGSHVAKEFFEKGYSVRVFDNLSTGYRENVLDGIEFVKGDIQDYSAILSALDGIDGVIHLAALKSAGESMSNPELYSTKNISGTINLLNACVHSGIEKFVFSSSAAVYGKPIYSPMDEAHPKNPENYYGYTKLSIEQTLRWYDKLKGLKHINLRYFNAVGYDIDEKITKPERGVANLMPIVMQVLNGERSSMSIYGDDYDTKDGTCIRDYIHVNDLADGHVKAYEYLTKEGFSDSFNLGTSNGISVKEMLDAVEKTSGKKLNYSIGPRRPGDPAVVLAHPDRACGRLGWEAKYSDLETIIKSMIQVYLK